MKLDATVRPSRWAAHCLGIMGLAFAAYCWMTWWYIPFFEPAPGPAPGIGYLPIGMFLQLPGCALFTCVGLRLPLRWWYRLLYAAGPLSYVIDFFIMSV